MADCNETLLTKFNQDFESDCVVFMFNYGVWSLTEQPSGSYFYKYPAIMVTCFWCINFIAYLLNVFR